MAHENLLRQGWHAWLLYINVVTAGKRSARKADKLALSPCLRVTCLSAQCMKSNPLLLCGQLWTFRRWCASGIGWPQSTIKLYVISPTLSLPQRQLDYRQITPLQRGVVVHIVSCPLAGFKGLVSMASSERVVVLLTLLGRQQEIRLGPAQLALAS